MVFSSSRKFLKKHPQIWLVLISLAYVLVWGSLLNSTSFWGDEEFTAKAMELDWHGMIQMLSRDMHPPLYYAVLRAWHACFAWAGVEICLRSFSLACGVLGLWAWRAVFGKLRVSPEAALGAVFLLAFSPFLGWYATEAKMYQFYVLVTALAWLAWLRLEESPASWGRRLAAGAATAAMPWTHITGMVAVSAFAVWLALGWRRARPGRVQLVAALSALLLAWLLFWPHWFVAKNQVDQTRNFWAAVPSWNLFADLAQYLSNYFSGDLLPRDPVFGLWLAVAGAGLAWGLTRFEWPARRAVLASLTGVFCAFWAGSHYHRESFLIPRVTLPWVPFFFLAVSGTLSEWGGRRLLLAGLGLFLAACLPAVAIQHGGPCREDMRGAAAYIARFHRPGDGLRREGYIEDYYMGRRGLHYDEDALPVGLNRYWLVRRNIPARCLNPWNCPENDPARYHIIARRRFYSSADGFWTLDVFLVQPLKPGPKRFGTGKGA